jgi:hypothetical protein
MAFERKPLPLASVPRRERRREREATSDDARAAPVAARKRGREKPGTARKRGREEPGSARKRDEGDGPATDPDDAASAPDAEAPAASSPRTTPGLSRTRARDDEDQGVPAAPVAGALAAALALLWLLRRRLLPRRLRRGPVT